MPLVGEFVTSLDMAGCSLTLTWLDDTLERLWCAPAHTVALHRGQPHVVSRGQYESRQARVVVTTARGSDASRQTGMCIALLFDTLADTLAEEEDELGRIDALAGDGEHGQGMARGSAAARLAAHDAVAAGAGAATVLSLAGDAWADRAGGTSGALWGAALRAWGQQLSDQERATSPAIAVGARAALDAITRMGKAKPGDKTMADALVPFVETLQTRLEAGDDLNIAWKEAAAQATRAAANTAQLITRLGRARPLAKRSLGHPDAGAVSLALCARMVGLRLDTDAANLE